MLMVSRLGPLSSSRHQRFLEIVGRRTRSGGRAKGISDYNLGSGRLDSGIELDGTEGMALKGFELPDMEGIM